MTTTTPGLRHLKRESELQARLKITHHRWWHANFCESCKARNELSGFLSGGILMALQKEHDDLATTKGAPRGSAH